MIIESQEDWWAALEKMWDYLVAMVERYHPQNLDTLDGLVARSDPSLSVTAPSAERACEQVRTEIAKEQHTLSAKERFTEAHEKRDHEALGKILSATWFGIPESMGAHSIAGFGVLCDLCSENWVFGEEEEG